MATRTKLHGRPLNLAHEVEQMYREGPKSGESKRAWGRRLAEKIRDLAATEVTSANFTGYIPDRLLFAVERERGPEKRRRLTAMHAA